jgi:hypothetical protein
MKPQSRVGTMRPATGAPRPQNHSPSSRGRRQPYATATAPSPAYSG